MTAPRNAEKIAITDEKIPLRTRVRVVFEEGMTITDLARKTKAEVADVKAAVKSLRKSGIIRVEVPHNKPGDALRSDFAGPTVTASTKANFRRAVSDDMAAQIAAFPAAKITKLPPGGYQSSFAQLLGSKAAWV